MLQGEKGKKTPVLSTLQASPGITFANVLLLVYTS